MLVVTGFPLLLAFTFHVQETRRSSNSAASAGLSWRRFGRRPIAPRRRRWAVAMSIRSLSGTLMIGDDRRCASKAFSRVFFRSAASPSSPWNRLWSGPSRTGWRSNGDRSESGGRRRPAAAGRRAPPGTNRKSAASSASAAGATCRCRRRRVFVEHGPARLVGDFLRARSDSSGTANTRANRGR